MLGRWQDSSSSPGGAQAAAGGGAQQTPQMDEGDADDSGTYGAWIVSTVDPSARQVSLGVAGRSFLCDTIDTSGHPHTIEYLTELAEKAIAEIAFFSKS